MALAAQQSLTDKRRRRRAQKGRAIISTRTSNLGPGFGLPNPRQAQPQNGTLSLYLYTVLCSADSSLSLARCALLLALRDSALLSQVETTRCSSAELRYRRVRPCLRDQLHAMDKTEPSFGASPGYFESQEHQAVPR